MIRRKTWSEFRNTGLLWFINHILHLFGWAIVCDMDPKTKKIIEVYPARVKFRGFSEDHNTNGYMKVTNYLKENIEELEKEVQE